MCNIDWAATGVWFQGWAAWANAATVLIAAIIAGTSYQKWLKQRQTERRMDVGEQVLTLIYKSKDVFEAIRSPGSTGMDKAEAEEKLRTSIANFDALEAGTKRRYITGQIALNRMQAHADLWSDYWRLLPLARAYFGAEFAEKFRDIWKARAEVVVAAQMYPTISRDQNRELYDKFECLLWAGMAKAAERTDEIDSALGELEAAAEGIILPLLAPEHW